MLDVIGHIYNNLNIHNNTMWNDLKKRIDDVKHYVRLNKQYKSNSLVI